MLTLTLIILTWYLTKLYYTRNPKIGMYAMDGLTIARCAHCSQNIVISEKELRTPYYCEICK